jgi:glycine cleavage system aminomethyltransferase T
MYQAHLELGATFRDEGDWRVPDRYPAPGDEVTRALAAVGMADVSACGKLCVRGEAIQAVLTKAAAIERFAVGTAERVLVEGVRVLALRPVPDELFLLSPVAAADAVRDVVAGAAAGLGCAHLTDVTSALAVVDVLGPRALDLLARVSPLDLGVLPVLGVVQGEVARVHATVARLDRPPVPTFRLLLAREYGDSAWEALHEAGHDLGVAALGAAARGRLDETS